MGEKFALGHLVYELTQACNQNCRFCYNHWRPAGSLPPDGKLARRTLSRLYSQAKVGNISFSGGEPTLLNNVHDLALKARFKGSSVNILTNGTLLSKDDILNFKNIGISALQIPLLSYRPETHDYLTGLDGSWEKAAKSIKEALRVIGTDNFAVVLVLGAVNCAEVEKTLEFYEFLGIKTVLVNRFNPGGKGLENLKELRLSREDLKQSFKRVSDFALSHPSMSFVSGVCTPLCLLDPKDYPAIRFTTCTTDVLNRPIALSWEGDVRFCNHSPYVLGNIWERTIGDILQDPETVQRYSAIPEQCADCRLFQRCKGGCRAASEQMYGSFDRVDPILNP